MLELYDFWCAGYAVATGVRLVKIIPGSTILFVFDDSEGHASRALGEWRCGRALVSAKEYATAVRQLKRIRFSATA